ncbi:sialidase family protein [Maribellus sp. YY47]|uniref:sialidase family protein n=1 Tax=Maribellus sp. YY47 TaxID=2929486 RepID=UPI002000A63C|nr:sialidase family protein [Maribellus sp. YY47]MCK3683213.1 glycoside hydrolase [Maribellus sp. YY47]
MRYHLLCVLGSIVLGLSACTGSIQTELEGVNKTQFLEKRIPLFVEKENPDIFQINLDVEQGISYKLKKITLVLSEGSQADFLNSVNVDWTASLTEDTLTTNFSKAFLLAGNEIELVGDATLTSGSHTLAFQFQVKNDAVLTQRFSVEKAILTFGGKRLAIDVEQPFAYRPAKLVRAAGQDSCDTYRIPGLVTTNEGTLIAVYDNRYNNSKDLQEDIDIGMSRSTDGGQTWEPMKVIMDMGEWGGLPQDLNGIGDPSVLYDPVNHTIWVAAVWMHGFDKNQMGWWASKPGMSPEETGQFMLVKSTDDGLTWSEPINITEQIKDPAWQYLLQGPGMGITLKDETLVFPAQFKADLGEKAIDGHQYTPHSTIIYSKDGGETWTIGTGAKTNTTEAQVVELSDGSLMLNMRDDRNRKDKSETNGRAVAITKDLGKSWEIHPSSNSALQEPNCMASLIAANLELEGETKQVLFFSNPNNKNQRTNMTIKASLDEGMTWPEAYQLELNEAGGFGYSCMTMVNENTVGILYEGVKELYFQSIPVSDIIR